MQVLKNTVPKSMWDTKSLNSFALNQVCVSAKMEEQLPSMPVSRFEIPDVIIIMGQSMRSLKLDVHIKVLINFS